MYSRGFGTLSTFGGSWARSASFLGFWAIAARWNSSRAQERPSEPQPFKTVVNLQMGKAHLIAAFAGLGPLARAADPIGSNTRPTISSRSTLTFATLPQDVPGTLAYIGDGLAANCGILRVVADEMAGGIRERGSRSGLL